MAQLLVVMFCILSTVIASTASSNGPSSTVVATSELTRSLITPSPHLPLNAELLKREQTSVSVCGVGKTGNYYRCGESTNWCVGTVLSNGKGYAYCSTYQVVDQTVSTAVVGNWKGHCPKSTYCCYADEETKYPVTAFFHVSSFDFTMTAFFCTDEPNLTYQYHAVKRVLDPTSVSAALASLAKATGGSSGLSSSEQNRIAVGVGVGGLLIIILGAAIFFWRRRESRGQQERDMSQPQSPQDDFSHYKAQPEPQRRPVELPSNHVQEMDSPWNSPELPSAEIYREPEYPSKR